LIWLDERGTLPPMNLGTLLDGIALPAQVRRAIDRLLQQKTRSSELGKGRWLRVLDRWIERQLDRGEQRCNDLPAKTVILAAAEDYFRRVVEVHR
jgi:predicted nucleotidyltransferase